jgi:steroid delta-isomerase-like uncharacterized protein
MSEANKALVRRWWEEGANKCNLTVMDDLFDADYALHHSIWGELTGREAVKQLVSDVLRPFPDGRYTVEDQVAEGDKVVTRLRFAGTHQGEFLGIASTGKQVTASGISICRIASGKIVEEWEVWDALGLMQQLGAVAPLAKAEDKAAA